MKRYLDFFLTINVIIFSMTDQNALPEVGMETAVSEQSPGKDQVKKIAFWIIGIFIGLLVDIIIEPCCFEAPDSNQLVPWK